MSKVNLEKVRIHKVYHYDETGRPVEVGAADVEDTKTAPVIGQEETRPRGFWIKSYDPDGKFKGCWCSECGTEDNRTAKFCGECGARMNKRLTR